MARLAPLAGEDLGALEPLLGLVEQSMGFRPNSMATSSVLLMVLPCIVIPS